MSRREQILADVKDAPDLPGGAVRAIGLLQNPEADVKAIARHLEQDVALTANLLRLANSAAHGAARRIGSVREALGRLGQGRVFQYVVALAVGPTASRPVKGYDLPAGALWEHSLSVALGAEELARELEIEVPEELFAAGLLHDVGKIVLGNFADVDVPALVTLSAAENLPFAEAERRLLEIDHPEVGARLLEHWGLPDSIVEACRWHHEPDRSPSLVTDLVHLADALSQSAGLGVGIDGLRTRVSREAAARRGLDRVRTERAAARMLSALEGAGSLLDVGKER